MQDKESLNVKIVELILEGKQYIYKEKQKFWVKYIKTTLTNYPDQITEIEEIIEIMKQIEEHPNQNQLKELCEALKEKNLPSERLAHMVKEVLHYSKLGPSFFETFYKNSGFFPLSLRNLVEQIKIENKLYQLQEEKNKVFIKH